MENKNEYNFNSFEDLKKNNLIHDYKFKFDKENGILNVYITPIKTVEFIEVNFTIIPTGTTFN